LTFLVTLSGVFDRIHRGHVRSAQMRSVVAAQRRFGRTERIASGLAVLTAFVFLVIAATPLAAQNRFILESSGVAAAQVATAPHGMVASQERRATEIGLDVLARGGNAVDAAVAVGFALAVTLPKAGNIGGGGFMVVHLADRHEDIAIDYREAAPAAARSDIFLGPEGQADPKKSRDTGLGVGVPGTVAGLSLALEQYGSGKFSLADLIAPAIQLARAGIPIENDLFDSLLLAQPRLAQWPSTVPIFLKADGTPPAAGDTLVQPDLAGTLEAIAHDGPRAFYFGPTADKIVTAVRGAGGVMVRGDLERYSPVVRAPVRGTYRGYDIVAMPPPSSGGIHLVEMLNILEGYPSAAVSDGSPAALHLQIEAMKLAYADRAAYLGDSDRVDVPQEWLVSKQHAAELRKLIDPSHAQAAHTLRPDIPVPNPAVPGSGNTTHFSVVDAAGNAVANTYTLNFNYGLGLVAAGTGIMLNNELDDFAAKPGVPNAFGLVGSAANAPGPEKRPLSSMTPTIVLKDGRPILVTGAPGGSRIITTVLQVVVNALDGGKPIGDAVAALRLHHQWFPDEVVVERGFPADKIEALTALGHSVKQGPLFGSAHSIAATPQGLAGAADLRARGAFAAGD
jgi:gamma-glutamyltranspeptidase/glutathione hydrolase